MGIEDIEATLQESAEFRLELVRRAAKDFHNASLGIDNEESGRARDAFIVISRALLPEQPSPDMDRDIWWRDFASKQYELATGEELALKSQKVKIWRKLSRLSAQHFLPDLGLEPNAEALAVAILNRDETVLYLYDIA